MRLLRPLMLERVSRISSRPMSGLRLKVPGAAFKASGSNDSATGCLDKVTLAPYGFRAYVPTVDWTGPSIMVTKFTPGHDTPVDSFDTKGTVEISFHFSEEMLSCAAVTEAITIKSTVEGSNETAIADENSVNYEGISDGKDELPYAGAITSSYSWTANLINVADGIHTITVIDAKSRSGSTGSTGKFLIRVGQRDNPIVFPSSSVTSKTLLEVDESGMITINHQAPGASRWRYSTNWVLVGAIG